MANQQTNQTANQQLKDQLDSYKNRITKSRKRKRIAYIAGLCLVAVAIVGLVVPAATLEFGKTYCGQEEHTHTDACVNRTVVCALPDTSNGNGHVHVPSCYDENSTLAICGKTPVAHMHLPSCVNAQGTALVCGQEETVHMHTLACVDSNTNTFACDYEGKAHVHGVTCYSLGPDGAYVLVCKEPSVGHVHTMLCLDPNTGEIACGQEEAIEIEHVHTDACYEEELICGMEEHVHNELCYDEITEAIMKKDEESSAAKEAAEEAEGVDGEAQGDLTAEEITEAKDQGLLFENEDVIVVFDVPEEIKDDIVLTVTETDEEVEFVEAVDATEEVNAEGEPVDDEAAQDGDNGEPVFFSENGVEADGTDKADEANKPADTVAAASKTPASDAEDEPAYKINLHVAATLAGEPVDDIESLGITAKLQMKPKVIAPILAEIDYAAVDPEIKDEVGAEITVLQQPDNSSAESISEVRSEQVDEVLATSVQEAATSFDVVASVFTARANNTPNPEFTVEYYAPLDTPLLSETKTDLPVIDTSGGVLPVNSKTQKLQYLTLDSNGAVELNKEEQEIYSSENYEYYKAPTLAHINKVKDTNYTLKEVKFLQSDGNGKVVTDADGKAIVLETYDPETLHFTNRELSEGVKGGRVYALIEKGAVIRLVYEPTVTGEPDNPDPVLDSTFYDYDISNGRVHRAKPPENPDQYVYKTAGQTFNGDQLTNEVLTWARGLSGWDGHLYAYTKEQGINSSGNYSGSGTKLAFGNTNTGTGLGKLKWGNNELNKYNNNSYQGCTFGLVTGLLDGKVQYAPGVQAPKLFNEGSTTGKSTYDGYDLEFHRVGDTYEIRSVTGTNANGLNQFEHPTNSTGTHTEINTNNFWPMDSAPSFGTGTHDVKFGGTQTFKGASHEMRFGPITQKGTDYTFPESDDGKYHNSYFGMNFSVEFELDKDYVGPLQYLFFGDDDLWVFLDDTLVVDIGGVHSSVGERVNLWDYLEKGTDGKHTLSIFYTERGASGSTCYMNFTLPSITTMPNENTTGSIVVSKEVVDANGSNVETGDEFNFLIYLNDKEGNNLVDDYTCVLYDKDGNELNGNLILWDGGEFTLKNGQYVVIEHLPLGTQYTIQEVLGDSQLYRASWDYYINGEKQPKLQTEDVPLGPGEAPSFTGIVEDKEKNYRIKYTNTVLPQLPATGGEGTHWYWIGGGLLVALALLMLWRRQALAAAPSGSSLTPSEVSVLAFFGDTNYVSPSGKPESVYSKGWNRAGKGDEATQKGGRY